MTMEDDEVPPFVEFNQQHMNDNNNDDCDDDLLSIVADDKQQHDEVTSVDLKGEESASRSERDEAKTTITSISCLFKNCYFISR